MGFDAMTSLSGGGALDMASSASADGDNTFSNGDFNYNNKPDNTGLYLVGGLLILAVLYMGRK